MIKFENTQTLGWEHAIRGMRNPMNSWDKSDSDINWFTREEIAEMDNNGLKYIPLKLNHNGKKVYIIGPNDLDLMKRLRKAGTDHRKYLRMITVYVDITAPLYWWKEFDTYKVGTVANSCSTMHKIHAKEFTLDDFSHEHLIDDEDYTSYKGEWITPKEILEDIIVPTLNELREAYIETKNKELWWQMIQLLPSSYNQKRTVMLNYEVLNNIYKSRNNHKLDEWSENIIEVDGVEFTNKWLNDEMYMGFCDWIKGLPYAKELITDGENV